MGKRKKRLLFDVLDDVVEPPRRVRRSENRDKKKVTRAGKPEGITEIRITRDMGITILVVMLAFVGCAYYSGLVHGRSESGGSEPVSLRKSADGDADDRSTWGQHRAIQARQAHYGPYTLESLAAEFSAIREFLIDEGYSLVDIYDYPSPGEETRGTLVLWVGAASESEELEETARGLRGLQRDGDYPFETAFVRLFTDRL